ncbi:MAG: T9SS type A sorting domain-containing protein [Bacteroidota bacterium]
MKKLFFFLLILWNSNSNAQTENYHPFPDSNAQWNIDFRVFGWPGTYEALYSIEISGDTLINSQQYHKLNTPYIQTSGKSKANLIYAGYKGAIRQDTVNRKVYIIPPSELTEQLLYDFTLLPGDTVKGFIETYGDQKDVVISVDSVLVGNNYRKRWNINLSYQISLIEGVGSTYGLIEKSPGQGADYPDISISCFRQNFNTIYPDTTTNCDIITQINPVLKSNELIKAYPNPSNGILNIEVDQPKMVKKIQVTDLLGNIVFLKEENIPYNLKIENLSAGIYFLSVIDLENKWITKKILNYP